MQQTAADLKKQVLSRQNRLKRRRSGPKMTTVAAYTGVFLFVMSMVAIGYQPPQKSESVANAVSNASTTVQKSVTTQPSVDQIVATQIAAGIAERAELPIASNIANLSISLTFENQIVQTDANVISKPQIIQPTSDSREVKIHTSQAGETATSIAAQYKISPTTLKWANNLTSDAVEAGKQLTIPPVDGILYTVKSGDTVDSIASKYQTAKDQVVAFNDLELVGVQVGARIILPGGALPSNEQPGYQAPAVKRTTTSVGSYFAGDWSLANSGNRYAYGNCTWYAYARRMQLGLPIGSFWGNAGTWAIAAERSGLQVDRTPSVGAIIQWNAYSEPYVGYAGHVGIVESVNGDGTITISEMNNAAYGGYGIVNRRTISASSGSNFIH